MTGCTERNSIIWNELVMPAILSSWEDKGCEGEVALHGLCARGRQSDIFKNVYFKLLRWVCVLFLCCPGWAL